MDAGLTIQNHTYFNVFYILHIAFAIFMVQFTIFLFSHFWGYMDYVLVLASVIKANLNHSVWLQVILLEKWRKGSQVNQGVVHLA